jgi:hypothetical protein
MRRLLWASLIVLFTASAVAQSAGRESTAETNGHGATNRSLEQPDPGFTLPQGL